ncbi:MAG: DEAD/DEAH box helicase [Acidobacteria bacterium]|nr:DEAD/DEAH box helicase [Acidobacteriota bacterium]
MHFWAPDVSPRELAVWLGHRVGERWPAPVEPAAFASDSPDSGGPGLTLAPLEAAATLAACSPREGDADFRSASLRFWSLASRFLLGLLSRGRFRPTVHRNGSDGASLWQADLESQQRELDALRLAAPAEALGGLDAETAISGYLVALGDSVIRDAGRRLGWSPGAVQSSRGRREVIERVLDDLFSGVSGGLGGESTEALWRVDDALGGGAADPGGGAVGGARLVFELEPPAEDSEAKPAPSDPDAPQWRIRFHLVMPPVSGVVAASTNGADSADEVPMPLAEVWNAGDAAANLRRFGIADPAIPLLENLGRAARAYPPLERGLECPDPTEVWISAAEAYEFLHEGQEALARQGFEVRIPPTLAGRRGRKPTLRLTVRPDPDSSGPVPRTVRAAELAGSPPSGGVGLDALVNYSWEVAIDDHTWTLDDFRRLTRGKRRLVRASDAWVELDQDAVNRLFSEAARRRAHADRSPVLRDALRERLRLASAAPDLFEPEETAPVLSQIEGEAWIGSLFGALEAAAEELGPLDPPAGLKTELRPYQRVGYGWLRLLADHGLGGCLADDMGLGKTCQALTFLLGERESGRLTRPWLLVCPNSIVANWRKEAERFAPSLRLHIRQGAGRSRGAELERALRENDLVVCSFGITHRDFDQLREVEWGGLIVDEAQNLKNPGAKQTRAVRRLRTPIRFALTGTPLENRLTDLWSIMEILNPGFLGPERTFRRTFTAAVEGAQDPEATEELRRLVRPFILRRLKTDPKVIRDLPEKHQTRVYCNLTVEQASLYQAAVDQCLERIERNTGFARRGEILRTLTRLKQICNHPENFLATGGLLAGRSGKLTRLVEILTEVVQQGERALVFTQFAEMAKLLAPYLSDVLDAEIPVLHGSVSLRERDAIVTRFQEAPDPPPVLVVSLKTGGYGLNLTRASHVVHYDRWWNPAVENQATDRAFRIGQSKRVLVHKFLCTGTLEERIADLLERKSALAESVIGTGEGWLTSLSSEALQSVLVLAPEAVAE